MPFNKKLLLIPVVLVFILIGIRLATIESLTSENEVFVSGTIEITKVDASFKIGGRVAKRLVDEGDLVKQGEQIALLDDEEIMQEVALKQAELEAQEAALLEVTRGHLPEEVAQAKEQLNQAEADFSRKKSDYERQKILFDDEVVSLREFDMSKSSYKMAEAKKKEAEEQYSLLKRGFREEKIAQAQAKVKIAREGLNLAKTKLSHTLIRAPIMGFIITENIESGEIVSPGTPIVTIGDLEKVWLRAYINQTDLGKVTLGQKVLVTTDTYPGKKYGGVISYISPQAEFTPKNVQTEKERVKLVYRIKVEIANPGFELKPGMPANGLIQIKG